MMLVRNISLLQSLLSFALLILAIICANCNAATAGDNNENASPKIVTLVILVRNKAHYLPYFLGYVERLNYNKQAIDLFIRVDRSSDESSLLLQTWLGVYEKQYRHVDIAEFQELSSENDEMSGVLWSTRRYLEILTRRQEGFLYAKEKKSDVVFYVDVDAMLINEHTIQDLLSALEQTPQAFVMAPLLNCSDSETFSNFWGSQTSEGFYQRSGDYFDIKTRRKVGRFPVPLVNTAFMLHMGRYSEEFSFLNGVGKRSSLDDMVAFSDTLRLSNLTACVDNTVFYGYFPTPLDHPPGSIYDLEQLQHMKLQVMLDHNTRDLFTLKASAILPGEEENASRERTKLGFDEIYCINLQRRPDRMRKMDYCFQVLGLDVLRFDAIDGKQLNQSFLNENKIEQLKGYMDPYHKRGLKTGEIGCFLSHYYIWKEMVEKGYEKVLILEDDIRFATGFNRRILTVLRDANEHKPDWDLLYVGRKRMAKNETYVTGSQLLVYPGYTYWTLGYVVTLRGATKLLRQEPLHKLVAVDEYLPILFDKHPQQEWAKHFHPRDLQAISAEPLLLEPTHYSGEMFYVSDTEDSGPWQ